MRLNLGCGQDKKQGFLNIDKDPGCKPDLVLDLGRDLLPIEDNVVDEVYGNQFLEHLYDHELVWLFSELRRVCRDGCVMRFVSPYMFSPVMGLIEHRKLLSEETFRMMGDWLSISCDIKFGVVWYHLKKVIPVPFLLPTSIHYTLVVKKEKMVVV